MAAQMSQQTSPANRFSVGYAVVWGLLSAAALGYLGVLAARPDLAARLMLQPHEGTPDSNFAQRSMSKALAELEAAKAQIAQLEGEAKQIKAVVAALEQRSLTVETRMGALETVRPGHAMPVADKIATAHKPEAERHAAATQPAALAGQNTQGTVEERPAKALREAPLRESRPPRVAAATTTGSIAKPAEPAAASPGPPAGVLIATGPSLDAVRLSWQLLNETNKSVLRPLEPRYVENSAEGGLFQLIAGPVGSREEAAKVCERLKARNARCTVTSYTGHPL